MEEEKTTEQPQGELEKATKERDEYLAGWQRARADLLNYKKEEMERIGSLMRYSQEEFVLKLLPVLDNLERAEQQAFRQAQGEQEKNDPVVQGCLQVISQMREFLRSQGVEPLQTLGTKFNPELHEALGEEVVEGKEPGTVLEEAEKGYLFLGKLLRPAKVKVAK
jgi:molecular chaperone GrpE